MLPALFTVLLAAHLGLVKVQGLAPLSRADGREGDPRIDQTDLAAVYGEPVQPFTSHLRIATGRGALILAISVALSTAFPAPLGPPGDPSIEVTTPPVMLEGDLRGRRAESARRMDVWNPPGARLPPCEDGRRNRCLKLAADGPVCGGDR